MIRNIAGRMQFNFAIEKKLFVYDSGARDGTMDNSLPNLHSGIRATIFGASGKAINIQVLWVSLSHHNSAWSIVALSCLSTSIIIFGTLSTLSNSNKQDQLVLCHLSR